MDRIATGPLDAAAVGFPALGRPGGRGVVGFRILVLVGRDLIPRPARHGAVANVIVTGRATILFRLRIRVGIQFVQPLD
jgi:hypothetical protein